MSTERIPLRLHRIAAAGLTLAALTVPLGCGGDSGPAAPTGPNVLLITLDTTRADYLSCYGAPPKNSPRIAELAEEGVVFERCVSTAGITPMSHASILTGLNNYRHGMRVFYSEECSHRLEDEIVTLPEILSDHGWATAASISAYVVSEIYNLDQGFDAFLSGTDYLALDATQQQEKETFFDPAGATSTQRRGDLTVGDGIGWLEDVAGADRPWFLWVHLFDVHDYTVVPPTEYLQEIGTTTPPVGTKFRPQEQAVWRSRLYVPELRWMDGQIGRLLDWLRDNGEYDDTLVLLTADHGQGLQDGLRRHGWSKHRLLFDWSIRVPLVIKLPGGEAGGTRVGDQVRSIDVTPTVLELLDLAPPADVEGLSVLGIVREGPELEPRLAYAEALNLYDVFSPGPRALPEGQYDNMFAVTDGRWKLVLKERDPEASELYDLAQDPDEVRNLYRADHPEVLRLRAFLDERRPWEVQPPREGSEAADTGALEGLGYGGDGEDEEEGGAAGNTGGDER